MARNVLRAHPVRSLVVVLVCLSLAVASLRAVAVAKSSSSVDKFKVPAAGDLELDDYGTGFQGGCYERLVNGQIGPRIEGVRIVFVSEDGRLSRSAVAQKGGRYWINLAPGRYRVTADRDGFESYSTAQGFFVAGGSEYRTGNFFLKRSHSSSTGYRGACYEQLANGQIGPKLPGVQLLFVSEDGRLSINAASQEGGFYQVCLPPGRYRVTAAREGFESYSTEQGFFVVGGSEYRTGNVFLKRSSTRE
jgi:hypothetical protein